MDSKRRRLESPGDHEHLCWVCAEENLARRRGVISYRGRAGTTASVKAFEHAGKLSFEVRDDVALGECPSEQANVDASLADVPRAEAASRGPGELAGAH